MSHISLWIDSYKGGTATVSNAASLDKDANRNATIDPDRDAYQDSKTNVNRNRHTISDGNTDHPSNKTNSHAVWNLWRRRRLPNRCLLWT
jgi:hypothetical protein